MASSKQSKAPERFGVPANVTLTTAKGFVSQGHAARVRAFIAADIIAGRGRKTVADIAASIGLSSSDVGRLKVAARIVEAIGATATDDDAHRAVVLVSRINGSSLGNVDGYVDPEATGAAMRKALRQADERSKADAADKRASKAEGKTDKSTSKSGKVETTGPTTDKGRIKAALSVLAAVSDDNGVQAEDVTALLAHALRVAFGSKASTDEIVATLADGLSAETVALVAAAVDAA